MSTVVAVGMMANLPMDGRRAEAVVDVLAKAVEDADLLRDAELTNTQPAIVFRAAWRSTNWT
ncbi:MAG TPA: hypothetical protein DEV93_14070 [Chloroflexi bacterium]|nr:hypothetical protein [Chloroflexota bacterium]